VIRPIEYLQAMHGISNLLAFPATIAVDFQIFEPPVDRQPGGRDPLFQFPRIEFMDRSFIQLDPSFVFGSRHMKINSRKKSTKVPLGNQVNIDHPANIRQTSVDEQSDRGSGRGVVRSGASPERASPECAPRVAKLVVKNEIQKRTVDLRRAVADVPRQ
jgi:hypothetical protein